MDNNGSLWPGGRSLVGVCLYDVLTQYHSPNPPQKKNRILALESSFDSKSICFPVCIPGNTEGIVGLCEDICVCCVFMRNLCMQGQRRS